MSSQIFLGFTMTCYLYYYLGTVAYDLLTNRKRATSENDKIQEGTTDISDEVGEFTPILITRPITKKQKTAAPERRQTAELLMSSGTEVNSLLVKVEDLSKDGENSGLDSLLAKWKEFDPKRGDISS